MAGIKMHKAGKNHYYTVDGEKYDGVTTLIGDGLPKPALLKWSADATAGYAVDHWDELGDLKPSERLKKLQGARFEDRDQAAKRGTEVHGLAEKLMHGEQVEVPETIAGHVESCVRFLDTWRPKQLATEFVVCNRRYRYCGKGDMVIELPDGSVAYADFKTSRSGIFGETALQAAAYCNAEVYVDPAGSEQPMASLGITRAYGVWIRADGFDVHPVDIGDETFKTFLHVATVARRSRTLRDLVGHAADAPKAVSAS